MISNKNFKLYDKNNKLSSKDFLKEVAFFSYMIRKISIGKQAFVLCIYNRSVHNIIIPFSIWNTENIYLPIDTYIPEEKLRSIINNHKISIIISDNLNIKKFKLSNLNLNVINIDDSKFNDQYSCPTNFNFNLENIAYCIFTSGTTGNPKGVLIKFLSLISRIRWQKKALCNSKNSFFIHKTSTSFDVSLWEIFLPVYCDAGVYVCDEKESIHPYRLNSIITNYNVTDIHFIPSMLHNFLKFNHYIPKGLSNIVCSGEELKPYHFNSLIDCPFVNLWNFYGPTETTIDVLYFRVNLKTRNPKIPLGKSVNDTNYKLISYDKNNSNEITYKLLISGKLLSPGYLNDTRLTEKKFYIIDGIRHYDTGDLVTISDNEIYFYSRVDNQIKLNGIRIEINEIEKTISQCLGDAFVLVLPLKLDENKIILAAFINSEPKSNKFLLAKFTRLLDASFFPKVLLYSDTTPRLSNGKINLNKINQILHELTND